MDDELRAAEIEAQDRALDLLNEHYENITIFASRFDPATGHTLSTWRGRGNWHARHGQIREWVIKQDAKAAIEAENEAD